MLPGMHTSSCYYDVYQQLLLCPGHAGGSAWLQPPLTATLPMLLRQVLWHNQSTLCGTEPPLAPFCYARHPLLHSPGRCSVPLLTFGFHPVPFPACCPGAYYLRLVGKAYDVYTYLEPLYNDFRRIRVALPDGRFALSHVDEVVDDMLRKDYLFDVAMPHIPYR